jgi:hypothetical protein
MYITLVVDDPSTNYTKAKDLGIAIIQEPEMSFYGPKRLHRQDPSAILVDVFSPRRCILFSGKSSLYKHHTKGLFSFSCPMVVGSPCPG